MRTIHCHERLGEQECENMTDPHLAHPVTMLDHTPGVHHECKDGHKFHLSSSGDLQSCSFTRATGSLYDPSRRLRRST